MHLRPQRLVMTVACVFTLLSCSAGADEERLASDVVPVSSSLGGSGPTGSSGVSSTTVVSNTAAQSASTAVSGAVTTAGNGEMVAATGSAVATVEGQLGESVRGFFAARFAASAAPTADPASGSLGEFATGEALLLVRDETTRRVDAGHAIRAGTGSSAQVGVGFVTVTGASAVVAVCAVEDAVIYETATNRVVSDAVMTSTYQIDLESNGARWLVARMAPLQQWQGVAGCARSFDDFPY